jgi:hypothetical protein
MNLLQENTIEIIGDACYFHTYDSDGNGEITQTELTAIFKRDDFSKRLFQGININKGWFVESLGSYIFITILYNFIQFINEVMSIHVSN